MHRLHLLFLLTVPTTVLATDVVEVARSYPDGGGYNRQWAGSGTPEALRFKGEQILAKGKGGTYCCGFTFTVAFKVAQQRRLLVDKTVEEIRTFQKRWYGVKDQSGGTLCVFAVERLGIGKAVTHADAKPGDMVQFWRTDQTGHSVMLLEWIEEQGQRLGIRYRSSQASTEGIGDRTEYFSDVPGRGGKILRQRTYVCRLKRRK